MTVPPPGGSRDLDFAAPIRRVRELLDGWQDRVRTARVGDPDHGRDLAPPPEGTADIVVGERVAAELGQPPAPSHALVLTTVDGALVKDGRVSVVGPDLDAARPAECLALAQVVMAAHAPGQCPDRVDLERARFLADRIPGVMVRAMPGRLWMRLDHGALERGVRLETIGRFLVQVHREQFPGLTGVEVALVTGADVGQLDTVAADARVLAGRIHKLAAVSAGVYECADLDCESCADRGTCDALRDVAIRYRERRGA